MITVSPLIEIRYKRSVSAELDVAIEKVNTDKTVIECFVLNDSDFYALMKELAAKPDAPSTLYDKLSNSYKLKYKDIPVIKKG
jgi:hypothetical protein